MKVKIGPHKLPITLKDQDGDYGSYLLTDGLFIDPNQPPSVMASTVIHEILHAIWEINRIPPMVTEEAVCEHLESALLDFLVDNYTLVQALRRAVLKGEPLKL